MASLFDWSKGFQDRLEIKISQNLALTIFCLVLKGLRTNDVGIQTSLSHCFQSLNVKYGMLLTFRFVSVLRTNKIVIKEGVEKTMLIVDMPVKGGGSTPQSVKKIELKNEKGRRIL